MTKCVTLVNTHYIFIITVITNHQILQHINYSFLYLTILVKYIGKKSNVELRTFLIFSSKDTLILANIVLHTFAYAV